MADLLNRRRWLQQSSIWLGSLLLVACHLRRPLADNKGGSQTFKLTSPAFAAEAFIPVDFTCDGADRSPALSWEAPPTGASVKSLTLILSDPDAPNGPFIHWVIYDLPPSLQGLAASIPTKPFLVNGVQGKNDFGQYGYKGPCPSSGTHRYFFRLYAVDKLLDLPPGASGAAVQAALKGHILAKAELMGRYTRQR